MLVVIGGNRALSGNRAGLITLGGGGVRGDLLKNGILRKVCCVVVVVVSGDGNVCPLGWSLLAAACEDVTVRSGDGPDGLF